jgi:epoxyqueuosine reductase
VKDAPRINRRVPSDPAAISPRALVDLALREGFSRARVLPGLLVCALPYGNDSPAETPPEHAEDCALIAPFARRNYYRDAVKRLQRIAAALRRQTGGEKSDYRIHCNSRIPEQPLAALSSLGSYGKNSLIITPESGSLVVLALMSLPRATGERFTAPSPPQPPSFPLCKGCDEKNPPCAAACPTGAIRAEGGVDPSRCIQWYASGNGLAVPTPVQRAWGKRLYGCTNCQDACPHNGKPIAGAQTTLGPLDAWVDARVLLTMSDAAVKARFKGTALGLSWLSPKAIRRNASCAVS